MVAGAVTQFWVKKLSPSSNRFRSEPARLRADMLNAFWLASEVDPSPPRSVASRSATVVSPVAAPLVRSSDDEQAPSRATSINVLIATRPTRRCRVGIGRQGEHPVVRSPRW